ncbi:MAG TPA: 30S ribosomal protein S17 [Pyrinomonadaceae bacterium]|nr:30S ribosomal protein S17 [Pyrinomonadaceae bacterium]
MAEENQEERNARVTESDSNSAPAGSEAAGEAKSAATRAHRSQKVGAVVSDKMQKTVVVRVDRLVRHTKYRRYVRRTSKFMAHDELGATIGDKVRIVETRPMSARKRWRVIEIVQKAAK